MKAEVEVYGPQNSRFSKISLIRVTGSTNSDLVEAAREGAAAGSVLIADHQTAGKGRQGRQWFDTFAAVGDEVTYDEPLDAEQTHHRALMLSLLVDTAEYPPSLLPLAMGVAACATFQEVEGNADDLLVPSSATPVRLKWPNDVIVPTAGDRKLAGILAEAVTVRFGESDRLRVVVGIGINLDLGQTELDDGASEDATDALRRAIDWRSVGAERPDRLDLARRLLSAFEQQLQTLESGGSDRLLELYRSWCCSIGRRVRLATPTGSIEGTVEGIANDGRLILQSGDARHVVSAGDVHHV